MKLSTVRNLFASLGAELRAEPNPELLTARVAGFTSHLYLNHDGAHVLRINAPVHAYNQVPGRANFRSLRAFVLSSSLGDVLTLRPVRLSLEFLKDYTPQLWVGCRLTGSLTTDAFRTTDRDAIALYLAWRQDASQATILLDWLQEKGPDTLSRCITASR